MTKVITTKKPNGVHTPGANKSFDIPGNNAFQKVLTLFPAFSFFGLAAQE